MTFASRAALLCCCCHPPIYIHYELNCLEKLVSYTFCYILDTLLVSKVNVEHFGIGAKLTYLVLDEMLMVFSIWSRYVLGTSLTLSSICTQEFIYLEMPS